MAPEPTIGRVVLYRSRVGGYDVPAVITATQDTLDPEGVELYRRTAGSDLDVDAQGVPPLSSPDHVHLTVFSPGLPGNDEPPKPMDRNAGGSYREWNVPLFEPHTVPDPRPGVQPAVAEPEPGTWRWPVMR